MRKLVKLITVFLIGLISCTPIPGGTSCGYYETEKFTIKCAYPPSSSIYGLVRDINTKKPLGGVDIKVTHAENTKEFKTIEDGIFSFPPFANTEGYGKSIFITASKIGYKMVNSSFTFLSSGNNADLIIEMTSDI